MRLSMKHMALLISLFGVISFIFGVVAENYKPAAGTPIAGTPIAGTPIAGKGVVICKYPSDPTLPLGYISLATLLISVVLGHKSVFFPYEKKAVPKNAIFGSTTMTVFFTIAWVTAALAATLLLWPIITQHLHLSNTVHHIPDYACPNAKTGLIGGGAFMSLNSALIWLVCLMLANNAREDYFEEASRV
ncbi:uncharacterized protein [Spinacia oleracea]|uniref:MARVEL domain-containing protein n=1 Tax=Spinacia oleracea TaxID=3562 RepID=A0A9R0HVU4_SPIOL|nr:uncharacterized protein LOC110777705 [Spinacia oleracea]